MCGTDFSNRFSYTRRIAMLAIKCGHLLLPGGSFITGGAIVTSRGKILDAGPDTKIPEGCPILDASDKWVTPGLIESHGHLSEDSNEMTAPFTPDMSAIDALDPFDPCIPLIRSAGFTTFCTLPGSSNLVGGTGIAVKLKEAQCPEDMIIPECQPLKMAIGENPKLTYGKKGITPGSRMGNAALIRRTFTEAAAYLEKREKGKLDAPDRAKEVLADALAGKRRVKIHCHTAQDITMAVRLAEEFRLTYTLEHVTSGRFTAEYLAEHQVSCCVGPLLIPALKLEMKDIHPSNPGVLERAGVSFSLIQDAGWDTVYLPSLAGLCTAHGLSSQAALNALTIQAARNLGLESRIGSLEPGKDADISIFTGNPLENTAVCTDVLIDGVHYEKRK